MRKLRGVAIGALALFAGWLALALLDALPRVPAEQRAALARVRSPLPAPPGRNLTLPALMLARRVPESEWSRWLETPPAAAQDMLLERPAPTADTAFPACVGRNTGCLAQVRAAPDAARAERDALAPVLRRVAQLAREAGHVAPLGALDYETPIPDLTALHRGIRLDATLRWLDGDLDGAFAQLCSQADFWRGLRRHSAALIAFGLGEPVLAGIAESYAELRRAAPPGYVPPVACKDALAPLQDDELSLCRAARGEFRLLEGQLARVAAGADERRHETPSPARQFGRDLAFDLEATLALVASHYDYWCSEPLAASSRARAAASPPPPARCAQDGWIFNSMGCMLAEAGLPPLQRYYERALDLDGRLRLLGAAEWLAQQERVDAATFARRPPELRDPRHSFEEARCSPMLLMRTRHGRGEHATWRLPLAAPSDCPAKQTR